MTLASQHRVLLAPPLLGLAAFLVPILVWVYFAISTTDRIAGLDTTSLYASLAVTYLYAAIVTALTFVLGLSASVLWLLESRRLRGVISVLMLAVFTTGLLARNYGWIGFLSSAFSLGIPILYSRYVTVFVMTITLIPVFYFVAILSFERIFSPMIDSARTMGVSEQDILLHVVLRGTLAQLVLGATLCFSLASAYFITPRMLGGNQTYMVGNLVVDTLDHLGNFASASYAALFLVVPMILVVGLVAVNVRHFGAEGNV